MDVILTALRTGSGPPPPSAQKAAADALIRADGSHWREKAHEWDGLEAAMMMLYSAGEGINGHDACKLQQVAAVTQLIASAPWTHPSLEVQLQFLDICQRFARVFGVVSGLFEPVVRALHGQHGIASRRVALRERSAYVLFDMLKQVANLPNKAGQAAVSAAAKPLLGSLRQRLAPGRLPLPLVKAARGGDASAQAAIAKV